MLVVCRAGQFTRRIFVAVDFESAPASLAEAVKNDRRSRIREHVCRSSGGGSDRDETASGATKAQTAPPAAASFGIPELPGRRTDRKTVEQDAVVVQ
jgi:hypothetical protein